MLVKYIEVVIVMGKGTCGNLFTKIMIISGSSSSCKIYPDRNEIDFLSPYSFNIVQGSVLQSR